LFDLLKKKIGKFTEKVKKRLEKTEPEPAVSEKADKLEEIPEKPIEEKAKEIEKPAGKKEIEEPAEEKEIEKPVEEIPEKPKEIEEPELAEEEIEEPEEIAIKEEPVTAEEIEEPAIKEEPAEKIEEPEKVKVKEPVAVEEIEKPAVEEIEKPAVEEEVKGGEELVVEEKEIAPAEEEEKRRLKPKVSVRGRLKAVITGSVELKESDLRELLGELELALLEADVEQTTAEEICREICKRLAGKKIGRGKSVEGFVKKEISDILLGMMQTEQFDLVRRIKEKKEKPFKILFLGPNGSGKTTSIAKLTWLLQSKGLKVIWAASDTFRAASIEQIEKHAENLGVRVIKHQYGADPAAVAFDAVKAAQSKRIDVVLVDSAGRQETDRNLMGELQKIARVVQPDLKVYVGEAYTGQSLLQQAKEYDKMVGIDGFILSKIDCDSKGGTTISLLYKLKKPILFVGTGQEYKDLEAFEPEFVLDRVMG